MTPPTVRLRPMLGAGINLMGLVLVALHALRSVA